MLKCSKCKEWKFKEEYSKYPDWCKPCKSADNVERFRKRREMLRRFKRMRGCSICSYRGTGYALQFDHIDPSLKTSNKRGETTWQSLSYINLRKELSNCRILCANCHAEHSYSNQKHLFTRNKKKIYAEWWLKPVDNHYGKD